MFCLALVASLLCGFFLKASTSFAIDKSPEKVVQEEVKIGIILPLSGSTAVWGLDAQRLSTVLEKWINSKNNRYRYSFTLEDGFCGHGNGATTAAQKLININKVRFLAVGCSGEILQVGPIAQRAGVLANCFACSHPDVKTLGEYVFRTYPDIENGIDLFVALAQKEKLGKVAVITEENSFTIGIRDLLVERLGPNTGYLEDLEADIGDFRTILTKLKASDSTAVFLNPSNPRTYIQLVRQMNDLDIDLPIFAFHMPADKTALSDLGSQQDGVRFIGLPDIDVAPSEFAEVKEKFLLKYREGPHLDFLYRSSYDVIQNYVRSIEAVGPDASKAKEFLQTEKFDGALGLTTYDERGDLKGLSFVIKEIVGGLPKTIFRDEPRSVAKSTS